MTEYEQLGHMVKANNDTFTSIQYFMPHHGVLRPSSTTTKLRVVFNSSSPTSTGYSLNDITYTGEKIQLDIADVLLWVRQHKYVFATDITGMYRQIMVHKDDWHLQQILWLDTSNNIIPYQLTTVTYGTRSAPYLAIRVLLQLVEDEGHKYPLASQAITNGRYVDDILGGADNPEHLKLVTEQLIDLCMAGGFPLAKWHSNNTSVLENIFRTSSQATSISFDDCNTKILGFNWNPSTDDFNFTSESSNSGSKITKRLILSEVAQIFDPLGFVSPTTVRAKMLLQELWLHKLIWDEQVPPALQTRWLHLRKYLCNLGNITLSRWINFYSTSTCELHGFADTSQLAMAAPQNQASELEARPATSKLKQIPDPRDKITPQDLEKARQFWIKSTQAAYFTQEIKSVAANQKFPLNHVFSRLTAFIDSEGILRAGGRLQHSELDPEGKHPAILPKSSLFTTLVINEAHIKILHSGVQLTLATLRQSYWVIGGRYPVKSFILRCVHCARQRGVRAQHLMGQLPQARVTPSKPFYNTGIDYAGPTTVKTWRGRGAKTQKAWIYVFVCMATFAVHLELVGDYSTEGFIAAYRRFISRRGNCHTLFADCGKNSIGAQKEIKNLFTNYTAEFKTTSHFIIDQGTNWSFNPPAEPHMGGKWESVVKSIKYHLSRTIRDLLLTFEEYMTLLNQIEALLNSRPLEPLSDDPEDTSALTPGHFLIGDALTSMPEPTISEERTSRLNRWQLIQQRTEYFWARWSTSYLQHQLATSKWFHERNDIKPGSLVLITDERFTPSKWPLARILTLHPGPDGLARVATIKTSTTTLTRPLVKLAPLPIITSDFDQTSPQDGTHQHDHQEDTS